LFLSVRCVGYATNSVLGAAVGFKELYNLWARQVHTCSMIILGCVPKGSKCLSLIMTLNARQGELNRVLSYALPGEY
jgi:hypothetical protein